MQDWALGPAERTEIEGLGAEKELEILGRQSSGDENRLYGEVLRAVGNINQLQYRALTPLCFWRVGLLLKPPGLHDIFLAFRNRVTLSKDRVFP